MATTYRISPFGTAQHVWVNKPDTKFNQNGVYKVDLRLEGQAAEDFAQVVDAEANAAFETILQEMKDEGKATAGELKKWSLYVPYTREEDDEGNPTGAIVFHFKQNATIQLKDGTTKAIQVGIKDSADRDMRKPVFFGSELRVKYAFRAIKMTSTKQAGVRLDFAMVQVLKLAQGGAMGGGFGAVEGGYVDDDSGDYADAPQGDTSASPSDGDY